MRAKSWIYKNYPSEAKRLRQLFSDDDIVEYLKKSKGSVEVDCIKMGFPVYFLSRPLAGHGKRRENLYRNGEIIIKRG